MILRTFLLILVLLPAKSFGRPCNDSDQMNLLTSATIKIPTDIDVSSCLAEEYKKNNIRDYGYLGWAKGSWYCSEGVLNSGAAMLTVQRQVMMGIKTKEGKIMPKGTCTLTCEKGFCTSDDACPFMSSLSLRKSVLSLGFGSLTIADLKLDLGSRFEVVAQCKDEDVQSAKINQSSKRAPLPGMRDQGNHQQDSETLPAR